MSRIGKKPIAIPDKVDVTIDNNVVTVKGPLGTLKVEVRPEVAVKVENKEIIFEKTSDDRKVGAYQGLFRTLVSNAVVGVSQGFTKNLEINGVGYRAAKEGNNLNLQLGYSHPVQVVPPAGIEILVEGTNKIAVKGADKQLVGDVAAEIRGKRPPEVYKGKGIKYAGEKIRRKAGKAGKK